MRRLLTSVVALLVLGTAAPAVADVHGDAWSALEGTGELAQSCPSVGTGATATYEVSDGVLRVLDESGEAVSDHALPGSGAWPLADRYTIETAAAEGRGVDRVLVTEGDSVRMEVLVDRAGSVPLALTSFAADGEVHCTFTLIGWTPAAAVPDDEAPPTPEAASLPPEVGGFVLGSVVVHDDFEAGLYGDGVFTFSLTVWDDTFEVAGAKGSPVGSAEPGPGRSLLSWPVDRQTYVLIGDLPHDLRDDVVAELPAPDQPGFFSRLWRRLSSLAADGG